MWLFDIFDTRSIETRTKEQCLRALHYLFVERLVSSSTAKKNDIKNQNVIRQQLSRQLAVFNNYLAQDEKHVEQLWDLLTRCCDGMREHGGERHYAAMTSNLIYVTREHNSQKEKFDVMMAMSTITGVIAIAALAVIFFALSLALHWIMLSAVLTPIALASPFVTFAAWYQKQAAQSNWQNWLESHMTEEALTPPPGQVCKVVKQEQPENQRAEILPQSNFVSAEETEVLASSGAEPERAVPQAEKKARRPSEEGSLHKFFSDPLVQSAGSPTRIPTAEYTFSSKGVIQR